MQPWWLGGQAVGKWENINKPNSKVTFEVKVKVGVEFGNKKKRKKSQKDVQRVAFELAVG